MSKTPKKVDLEGKGGSDQFFNTCPSFREPISSIYEFFLFLYWVPLSESISHLNILCRTLYIIDDTETNYL